MTRTAGPVAERLGWKCPTCDVPLRAHDAVAIVGDEPADDDQRAKKERGSAYTAVAFLYHEECAP